MSLLGHSSVGITIEMSDFDCLHRQFPITIICICSFKPGYFTYCAEHHQVQAVQRPQMMSQICSNGLGLQRTPQSAGCAATSNQRLWLTLAVARPATTECSGLLQLGWRPLCCASCTTVLPQQRSSGRCMALPATCPSPTTGPRNEA